MTKSEFLKKDVSVRDVQKQSLYYQGISVVNEQLVPKKGKVQMSRRIILNQ